MVRINLGNNTLAMKLLSYLILSTVLSLPCICHGKSLNGFDITHADVPISAIKHGGPPRDGIPAINEPNYIHAEQADFMRADDRVLGFVSDGTAIAFPLFIMNWHELVNDQIDGQPFVISYCPLCGTGMAFSSTLDGDRLIFGVSGLLYNSDVLFYDKQSESLWSQIRRQAITGTHRGRTLEQLPLAHTTWERWQQQHPSTKVLTPEQGYSRNYRKDPYRGYETSRALFFEVAHKIPKEYHTKEKVLGVLINGQAKAYPFIELRKQDKARFNDIFADKPLVVRWDKNSATASIEDAKGNPVVTTVAFWFAWYAFHPDTAIFRHRDK